MDYNIYQLLSTIDGILSRLTAVQPSWKDRHGGPTQWLYLAETQDSHESELSRLASTLSAPSFPDPRGPKEVAAQEPSIPCSEDGNPLPLPGPYQTSYSVDFRMVQVLSGVRAVLLVLVDSAALVCHRPDGVADPSYIGSLPASNALSAVRIMASWPESAFVPNAKYWKDWPLARFLENPLPPLPLTWSPLSPEDPLFSGELRRFFTRASRFPWEHSQAPSFFRLVFGISQSKRGFATVPRSFVRAALVKHRHKLSTPPTGDPDFSDLRRFVKVLLRGFQAPLIVESLVRQEASTRASADVSRALGGSREDLREQISSALGNVRLVKIVEIFPGHVVSETGLLPPSRDEWRSILNQMVSSPLRPPILLPRAKVAEVLEPLKVRLITAMHALRTFIAKPLQEALWRCIRDLPPFRLVGEEISIDVVRSLIERHYAAFGTEVHDLKFVSGDYSAATDGLDIRASKVILEEILNRLHPTEAWLRAPLSEILLEQVLEYPPWSQLEAVTQANGQLMGSILSFPILCIANLFTYVLSLPIELRSKVLQGRVPVHRLPVLVNGDDILFLASPQQHEAWLKAIQVVGFVPSVGKNFIHPRFFTVNSVPLEYVPDRRRNDLFWFMHLEGVSWADLDDYKPVSPYRPLDEVHLYGYLNVGLLTGQAKLTGSARVGSLPLSGWHSGSVLQAMNPVQAHKWFLHYHLKEIREQTRFGLHTLNLFAHPLLGGLGFRVPPGVEPRFSEAQRVLARQLFLAASVIYEGQSKDYPLPAFAYLSNSEKASGVILGHRLEKVEVVLYPYGSPLPEGASVFEDRSAFHMTPLSQPLDPEISPMVASCRLSNRQLTRLLSGSFRNERDLHPLELMGVFPFLPIRVDRETIRDGTVVPIVPVYVPQNFFWDESPPDSVPRPGPTVELLAPGDDGTALVVPSIGPPQELWELPTLSPRLRHEIQQGYTLRDFRADLARADRRELVRSRRLARQAFRRTFTGPSSSKVDEY